MVDIVLHCAWVLHGINKNESYDPLTLVAFRKHVVNAIFLKYSKEDRLPSTHLGI